MFAVFTGRFFGLERVPFVSVLSLKTKCASFISQNASPVARPALFVAQLACTENDNLILCEWHPTGQNDKIFNP